MNGRRAVLAFIAGVLAVLAALSWVTVHTLRLESRELIARADAKHQETIRLVLWRMDSALTPIIAREAARPYFEYQPFYPADPTFSSGGKSRELGEVLVPSPLLAPDEKFVHLYFQREPDSTLTSPQVPSGDKRKLADLSYVTSYSVAAAEQRLAQLSVVLAQPQTLGILTRRGAGTAEQIESLLKIELDKATVALEEDRKDSSTAPAFRRVLAANTPLDGATRAVETAGVRAAGGEEAFGRDSNPAAAAPPASGKPAAVSPAPAPTPQTAQIQSVDPQSATGLSESSAQSFKEYQARQQAQQNANVTNENRGNRAPALRKEASISPSSPAAVTPPSPTRADPEVPVEKSALTESGTSSKDQSPSSKVEDSALKNKIGKADDEIYKSAEAEKKPYGASEPDLKSVADATATGSVVSQGQFAARWVQTSLAAEPELIFEREIDSGGTKCTQGIWLDWPALKQMLLATASPLIPHADLTPVLNMAAIAGDESVLGRTLAAIPVVLVVPPIEIPQMHGWSPARITLVVMWLAVLCAIAITAAVLAAAMELAQRRGRFVSAVTHELRTPLTTFCLYSQMLADGMVPEGEPQRGYFQTLKTESQRLARIVESVLDYARLSGKRSTKVLAKTSIADLVLGMRRSLLMRCEQSHMILSIEGDAANETALLTDAAMVDRIVFNLVENACKYAADATDKRIHLCIRDESLRVVFTIIDHGPGIAHNEVSRVFKPFIRGNQHGHGAIPGLGLGLAIALGLANELGGTLELAASKSGDGATFELAIPK